MSLSNATSPSATDLNYASVSSRFVALLIDLVCMAILVAMSSFILPIFAGIIVWFFYAPLLESSELQATLGKHLIGIQVSDLKGRRLSLKTAVLRNVLKSISFVVLLLGFVIALVSDKKQTLHDMLLDTVVVYGRVEKSVFDVWVKTVRELFLTEQSVSKPKVDVISELERLQALREKGAISEEEFQSAKLKIFADKS